MSYMLRVKLFFDTLLSKVQNVSPNFSVINKCKEDPFRNCISCKLWIYEIHIFELQNEEINVKKILAVIHATYAVAERKPEKNQACRDSNPDLCDTSAAL